MEDLKIRKWYERAKAQYRRLMLCLRPSFSNADGGNNSDANSNSLPFHFRRLKLKEMVNEVNRDEDGNRTEVVLPIEDYEKILEELEELEAIRAYDAAKASDDEAIPAEQAFSEVETSRS